MPPDALHKIYSDLVQVVGFEIMKILHEHYSGQQISFPKQLYSQKYIDHMLLAQYDGTNAKELARKFGYTERWIKDRARKLKRKSLEE